MNKKNNSKINDHCGRFYKRGGNTVDISENTKIRKTLEKCRETNKNAHIYFVSDPVDMIKKASMLYAMLFHIKGICMEQKPVECIIKN